jgi:kojibiose phosphorylase
VIGPDEYHDHVDNNIYTNRMAQWHLQAALDILDWLQEDHPEDAVRLASALDLSPRRLAHWQDVIDHIIIHHDAESGLLLQCDGFFDLEPVDWAKFAGRNESIQFLLGIEKTNESLVLKQPDAIMLLCLLRDHYDRKTWQATWDAYVPITDHSFGSSLSPSIHAWAACELDMPEAAYDYLMLAANADLHDVRGNAGDGIHAASAGGIWQAIVFGFAGLRLGGAEGVSFSPRLPSHWQRLAFNLSYQGMRQFVEIDADGNFTVYSRQKP